MLKGIVYFVPWGSSSLNHYLGEYVFASKHQATKTKPGCLGFGGGHMFDVPKARVAAAALALNLGVFLLFLVHLSPHLQAPRWQGIRQGFASKNLGGGCLFAKPQLGDFLTIVASYFLTGMILQVGPPPPPQKKDSVGFGHFEGASASLILGVLSPENYFGDMDHIHIHFERQEGRLYHGCIAFGVENLWGSFRNFRQLQKLRMDISCLQAFSQHQ